MILYPPDDPFLFSINLFGLPIAVRWYGVIIMSGALIAAYLAARRAAARGYDPDHIWNQLMLGLLLGIGGARIYYVAFEWERFAADPLSVLNLTTGGLAIHGGIIGSVLAVILYSRWNKIPFWDWIDICVPAYLLGQAIGRWGNFFNQEAYGRPTSLPVGVRIDPEYRLPPYTNMQQYPADTLFHATFLYESLWNLAGVGALLWADRRLGFGAPAGRRWLRPGDLLFLYAIIYSAGRFWIEGLRTDSLCLDGVGGSCEGSIRVAQLISLAFVALGALALFINHRRPATPADGVTADTPRSAEAPAEVAEPAADSEADAQRSPAEPRDNRDNGDEAAPATP
jgi:phosphatidylglycerol:prolipoprotein diacylglycerol transferase